MAAIPTWALAQQSTAKTEPAKAADAKPPLAIDFGLPVAADKSSAERELEALKAEMDSLNARLKQLQADKAKQLSDQKAVLQRAREDAKIAEDRIREVQQAEQKPKLLQAKQQADIAEDRIREAKKAEAQALDATIKARLNAVADQAKQGVRVEGLQLRLGEFKVQSDRQAAEKEKVAADSAAKLAQTTTQWKATKDTAAPAVTVNSTARQILRSGSQGVKVIGADGKEIPGVIVIIDKQVEVAAPPAKVINSVPGQAVNGEQKYTLLLQDHLGTIHVNPGATPTQAPKAVEAKPMPPASGSMPPPWSFQAPKAVEAKPMPPATNKTIQIVPATPPAAPIKVEGLTIQLQPAPTPPAAPAAPAAPARIEGLRILMQPGATPPVVPPQPVKQKSDFTWTFDTVNLHAPAANTITLSRATYKLPKEQAATLATLLGGLKHIVMETKVDNDTLVVTTTPEAQKEIAGFVRLITGAVMKVNFSVPLPPNSTSHTLPTLPALPTAQAAPAMPGTVVGEFKAIDTKGNFTVVADEAPKANVQFYQILQGKNDEMTIVGTTEKPKTENKKIEIKATEKNGNLAVETFEVVGDKPSAVQIKKGEKGETIIVGVVDTAKPETKKIDAKATVKNDVFVVETVDVAGAKTKVLHIKKGENGEMIIIDATEGQGEAKGTIRLNGTSTIAPATPMKVAAPAAPATPIQIKVVAPVAPTEAPKKAAPATPSEKSK